MQAYNASFARIYNLRWANFAQNAAPRLRTYYESTLVGHENHRMLDLCCGTGQLAMHFLDHEYEVTGLDLSEAMLDYARANAAAYIVAGQAHFVLGDAANFELDDRFGLVVSTFDALNHLPDFTALKSCFLSVYPCLVEGGLFIFDLNTEEGLRRWTGIMVEDQPELMLVTRSLYDEASRRAFIRISGFAPAGDDLYERFEETTYEVPFDLAAVRTALFEVGFQTVHFARLLDLGAPVDDPEHENRIFILAEK
ncbi:MAG: class I SAM-dependent methyltransferase [Chloroflexi bacterium]|nr:MAG: class I SAM-dependent methyltransferase [Chloroflexota bacterium]